MHIAIITAGGAGMFCGSCMHDNTWARALLSAGAEVSLIPTYTPIRVDEPDASLKRVFLGGINVYLNDRWKWWRSVPRAMTRWLDSPGFIKWATQWSVSNDSKELGDLTLSMLAGEEGPQKTAIGELADFLKRDLRPDVIIFSNALLVGAAPEIQRRVNVPVWCVLQGDDVFLDGLTEDYRARAIKAISDKARVFDGFLTHTRFYRDYISRYLNLPVDKFHTLPLGMDMSEHTGRPGEAKNDRFTIGYFARLSPEKGLNHFVDGAIALKPLLPDFEVRIGGYHTPQHRAWSDGQLTRLKEAGVAFQDIGSPDTVKKKVDFFSSLDAFSTPTEFLEPKGMYVLEALANGVPVVQPAHGSFPEILEATGGGLLVPPRDPQAWARAMAQLADPAARLALADAGWRNVRELYSAQRMAQRTLEILRTT